MAAVFKRQKAWKEKLQPGRQYPVDEALTLVKELATAKFERTFGFALLPWRATLERCLREERAQASGAGA
jgi:hypothetical protein